MVPDHGLKDSEPKDTNLGAQIRIYLPLIKSRYLPVYLSIYPST